MFLEIEFRPVLVQGRDDFHFLDDNIWTMDDNIPPEDDNIWTVDDNIPPEDDNIPQICSKDTSKKAKADNISRTIILSSKADNIIVQGR